MADIELVIKIPEEDYLVYSELSEKEKVNELTYYEKMIANGIPLPKGHGNLVDTNELIEKGVATESYLNTFIKTIIKADKE